MPANTTAPMQNGQNRPLRSSGSSARRLVMTTPPARIANSLATATSESGVRTAIEPADQDARGQHPAAIRLVRRPVLLGERVVDDHEVDRHRERIDGERQRAALGALDQQVADQSTVGGIACELQPIDGVAPHCMALRVR